MSRLSNRGPGALSFAAVATVSGSPTLTYPVLMAGPLADTEPYYDLGGYRRAEQDRVTHLSRRFDEVVRALLGQGSSAHLTLDGNGLHLHIELGGERSTAALESLKVISFDIAALLASMEGRTKVPAFLIHDSPREADLGLSIYHKLFFYMADLERISDKPLFQYIITTTTEPPTSLAQLPHLRVMLQGAPAEQRLLRTNL